MHVRCPHCHHPIEILDDASLSNMTCPSCDSRFDLVGDETVTYGGETHTTIGHFELHERIGTGAFGTVWKALDTDLDRTVAVKIPRKGALDEKESEQFFREARAAAQLKHSNIVSIHEVGREVGIIYIVSDFVEGLNLADWLTGQQLTFRESSELCLTIAEALEHAHQAGVIHRDLKPSNILIDADGEPHIMDFGLAKRESGEITMTIEGQILGTPAYMSPEQARGEGHDADARSDVYSLGVILFELLTGELPFRGNKQMLIHQKIHDEAPSPRKLNSSIPRDLETVCLKCLEKDPALRFQTAQELADDLQRYLRKEPIKARPVTRIERMWRWCRRNPVVSFSIATVLLVVLVAGIVVIVQRRANQAAIAVAEGESERKEIQTTVATMSTVRGILVPHVIKDLNDFPREMVLVELREQFETADETRKLPLAYALAYFDDVRVEFLVSQVEGASPNEVDNFVAALNRSSTEAVTALENAARTAESEQNWQHKARLAMLSLRLNIPELAQDMCRLRPDPIQRTWFIEECSTWHGDLSKLAQLVADSDDGPFRSAIILAVGSAPVADVSPPEKQAWEPVLLGWYERQPDTLTHSAAGWTLRKWNLELPEITTSKAHADGMNWHVNGIGMTMLTIPAGSFVRKDISIPRGDVAIEQTVTLSRSFLLADREVTRAQFQQFMDDPDCADAEKPKDWEGANAEYSPTERHPVQQVSWYDALLFCNWLSRQEGLTPCYKRTGKKEKIRNSEYDTWQLIPEANGYRLPTEAEWEYACRAGTVTTFSHGNQESLLYRYAVFRSSRTELPGSKLPNGWGLFDVHGNVYEWCHDWYGPFGSEAALSDPLGPAQVTSRVLRGGSFINRPLNARSASRFRYFPPVRDAINGLRVARTYP